MFTSWCICNCRYVRDYSAAEALKYIVGERDLLTNRLLIFDALKMRFRTVKVKPDPKMLKIEKLQDYEQPVCDLKQK